MNEFPPFFILCRLPELVFLSLCKTINYLTSPGLNSFNCFKFSLSNVAVRGIKIDCMAHLSCSYFNRIGEAGSRGGGRKGWSLIIYFSTINKAIDTQSSNSWILELKKLVKTVKYWIVFIDYHFLSRLVSSRLVLFRFVQLFNEKNLRFFRQIVVGAVVSRKLNFKTLLNERLSSCCMKWLELEKTRRNFTHTARGLFEPLPYVVF